MSASCRATLIPLASALLVLPLPVHADDARLRLAALDTALILASATQQALATPRHDGALAETDAGREAQAPAPTEPQPAQRLWLEVSLNGHVAPGLLEIEVPAGSTPDGNLSVALDDWQALGLVASISEVDTQGRVALAGLSDIQPLFDSGRQRLQLTLPASRFQSNTIDVFNQPARLPEASALNAVLNYDVFVQHARPPFASGANTEVAGFFDGRLSGDWGNFNQSLISQVPTTGGNASVRRLDTSYRYYDPVNLTSWQLGDAVSIGLVSRPAIRFGGLQWRRNFSLRPDLVTFPAPSISGSSAVPTSVDVYVDQIRRSQLDVPAGPFTLNQLPVLTGPHQVQVVVRDALGREQVTTLDLFASPQLLRPGLFDFAVQTGFSRHNYAQADDRYSHDPLAIGSVRYGLTSEITLEGQSEYAREVSLLSAGVASLIGRDGSFGINLAGSRYQGDLGGELNGRFDYYLGRRLILNGSFSEASDRFRDISSLDSGLGLTRSRQQLALSQGFDNGGTLAMSWIRQRSLDDSRFSSLMLTAARNIAARGYLSVSGWRSLEDERSWGASIGLNWFLGDRQSAGAYYEVTDSGSTGVINAQSNLPMDPGWGWRVDVAEGQRNYRRAELLNRNRISDVSALIEDGESGQIARLGMIGALAWMPGTVQAGRRINDAYALVDLGYPDVAIFLENRPIGRTDDDGFLLVNDLNAYQQNKLSLEALDLPLEVSVGDAERRVVPARESGVRVSFDIERNHETLLALKRHDGSWFPLGARILLPTGEQRVIGHDGQVLVPATLAGQTIEVLSESARCPLGLPSTLTPDQQHTYVLELKCP
ncbi:MAG: fimbria/pilus outer membrane usher protein [Pseudomonadota bacterium]